MKRRRITYADAGVNIDEADRAVKGFKDPVRATYNKLVLAGLGAFGGLYEYPHGYKKPVLVASTDGVGTKLKVAIMTGQHRTVGIDLVNHCVNDIAVQGARPLFFLDYFGSGRLDAKIVDEVVQGVAEGCVLNGIALLGGETAEMPGFYTPRHYDLVGTAVGAVDKSKIITPRLVREGDILLALPSSGLHTNGYSLARKLFFKVKRWKPDKYVDELGCTVGEELLKIHVSYFQPLQALLKHGLLHGAAHITGGGITDNVPRILPSQLAAEIYTDSWDIPPVFQLLRSIGNVPLKDYRRTFNLGVGMVFAVPRRRQEVAEEQLRRFGKAFVIGQVVQRGNEPLLYV